MENNCERKEGRVKTIIAVIVIIVLTIPPSLLVSPKYYARADKDITEHSVSIGKIT